ncbi:ran guanine nucleotide release factor [Pelomyxa schiedti]|nr:ran guanine nucleotide release factor [Pelomyxa schiedti]
MASETYERRQLYGGAIEAEVPARFDDISEVRQVEDNQEVFSDARTDQSIIFEIAEYEDTVGDGFAPAHYLQDIAEANDATGVSASVAVPFARTLAQPEITYCGVIVGQQDVAKFREHAKNTVRVYLCVMRLPSYRTDLLISMNAPMTLSEQSSSSGQCGTLSPIGDVEAVFNHVIQSFNIKDFGLFG